MAVRTEARNKLGFWTLSKVIDLFWVYEDYAIKLRTSIRFE